MAHRADRPRATWVAKSARADPEAASRHLFGEAPQPIVDATVTTAWLPANEHRGDEGA